MRKSFEQTITGPYQDIAKEQIRQEEMGEAITPKEKGELDTVLNWHLGKTAEARYGERLGKKKHLYRSVKNQKKVFELQKQKQEIIKRLEEERRQLNNPDYLPEKELGSRKVSYDGEQFLVKGENGQVTALTLGEIITDYEFGINYYLDSSVPRAIQKKYALEKARRQLHGLLEEQIIYDDASRGKMEVGAPIIARRKVLTGKVEYQHQEGFLAEIMVSNFLEKLSIDYDVDFKLVKADVYEDVFHKIDFFIKRKSHNRGVKVEEIETENTKKVEAKNFGIQFTLRKRGLLEKRKQISQMKEKIGNEIELDDIVLVSVPLDRLRDIYSQWNEANRPSGGPDKLWDKSTKHFIVERIFQNILSYEEITYLKSQIE